MSNEGLANTAVGLLGLVVVLHVAGKVLGKGWDKVSPMTKGKDTGW